MAQGNIREYFKGERVRVKKNFYVLRPILAIKWIEQGYGVAPTSFGVLLERIVPAGELKDRITALIEQKSMGDELDYGDRSRQLVISSRLNLPDWKKTKNNIRITPHQFRFLTNYFGMPCMKFGICDICN